MRAIRSREGQELDVPDMTEGEGDTQEQLNQNTLDLERQGERRNGSHSQNPESPEASHSGSPNSFPSSSPGKRWCAPSLQGPSAKERDPEILIGELPAKLPGPFPITPHKPAHPRRLAAGLTDSHDHPGAEKSSSVKSR